MGILYFSDQILTKDGEAFVQVRDGGNGRQCYFGVIEAFELGNALTVSPEELESYANKLIAAARVAREGDGPEPTA